MSIFDRFRKIYKSENKENSKEIINTINDAEINITGGIYLTEAETNSYDKKLKKGKKSKFVIFSVIIEKDNFSLTLDVIEEKGKETKITLDELKDVVSKLASKLIENPEKMTKELNKISEKVTSENLSDYIIGGEKTITLKSEKLETNELNNAILKLTLKLQAENQARSSRIKKWKEKKGYQQVRYFTTIGISKEMDKFKLTLDRIGEREKETKISANELKNIIIELSSKVMEKSEQIVNELNKILEKLKKEA
jgi:hypothetical protein